MKHYKTVLIDFDVTLLDTSTMPQYSANVRQYKRYSPEWHQARKELLAHIADCPPYEGWPEVWKYLEEHKIQAAIVTSRGHDILNRAVKDFDLKAIFPKMKVNRIGGKDATGHQEWKKGGNPILFQHALKQLNIPSDDCSPTPIIPASLPLSRSSTSWNKPLQRLSNNLSSHNPKCRT